MSNYMELALNQAQVAMSLKEVPVGAIIVDSSGSVISRAHNMTQIMRNSILHAEIIAINKACLKLKTKYLLNCDMYVTLEPCDMCINAISLSRIRRLYYGAHDFHKFQNKPSRKTEVYGGILEVKASNLIKDFFKTLRNI